VTDQPAHPPQQVRAEFVRGEIVNHVVHQVGDGEQALREGRAVHLSCLPRKASKVFGVAGRDVGWSGLKVGSVGD